MTAPANRPATPEIIAAATDRARESFAELERLDMADLSRLSLSLRDVEARSSARDAAVQIAEHVGLGPLLEAARLAARHYVTNAFDTAPFRAIGVDVAQTRSRASLDDRVAVTMAAEDAVIAAVAGPFLADDVGAVLEMPLQLLRPAWDDGIPMPREPEERRRTLTRQWAYLSFGAFVLACLVLAALGFGVGLFGLGAAIAIVLVALVVRGRPSN